MDDLNETRAYVRRLHRDVVGVQAQCAWSRQLIRDSRQLMASISQQTKQFHVAAHPGQCLDMLAGVGERAVDEVSDERQEAERS